MNPDQASLFEDMVNPDVRSITSTHFVDDKKVTTIIGEQPDGGFGISQAVEEVKVECTDSPDKLHHIDPIDKVCLYCGKGEE